VFKSEGRGFRACGAYEREEKRLKDLGAEVSIREPQGSDRRIWEDTTERKKFSRSLWTGLI
jgi:hypothetical protein